MDRTETGATVVAVMKRRRRQSGQALVEYGFLLVLLATITFAVVVLAGSQLQGALSDVNYELTHLTDATTLAPNGTTQLGPGATPDPSSCPPGQTAYQRGHKWHCR
jgi:Flp pilus assembly pilin Flp